MSKETKKIGVILIVVALVIGLGFIFALQNKTTEEESEPENVETSFTFYCPNEKTVTITYYNDSESAKLNFEGKEYDLQRAVSGSGSRYTNEDESVVFWEHQGEVMVEIDGEKVVGNCTYIEKESDFKNYKTEEAITDYLLTQEDFSWQTASGSKNFCVIKNLIPENDLFPHYVWTRCSEFIIRNGELKELSGSSLPVKIDYPNKLSYYDLDQFSHQIPGDGAAYSQDVEELFPEEAQEMIRNFQEENIILINQKLEQKALEYFSSSMIQGTDNLWEIAKNHIKDCNVREVYQNHNKIVTLKLESGDEFKAMEPSIDDVFRLLEDPKIKDRCGEIIMSTE